MVGRLSRLMAQVPVVSPNLRRLGIHNHDAKGPDSSALILRLHATAGLVCVTSVPSSRAPASNARSAGQQRARLPAFPTLKVLDSGLERVDIRP